MRRTFLTKTARTQKQTVQFFRDPFRLVPIENIAEIADKFTRNEIMTSNEIRQIVGYGSVTRILKLTNWLTVICQQQDPVRITNGTDLIEEFRLYQN